MQNIQKAIHNTQLIVVLLTSKSKMSPFNSTRDIKEKYLKFSEMMKLQLGTTAS